MRTVEIEDDVFEALQKLAVPLVDTTSSVIRRLIDQAADPAAVPELDAALAEVRATRDFMASPSPYRRAGRWLVGERAPRGSTLPDTAYELPVLQALIELGGSAPTDRVLGRVYELMAHELNPLDHEPLPSGSDIRWRNRAQFARMQLVRKGDMQASRRRGLWEISDSGRRRFARESRRAHR